MPDWVGPAEIAAIALLGWAFRVERELARRVTRDTIKALLDKIDRLAEEVHYIRGRLDSSGEGER